MSESERYHGSSAAPAEFPPGETILKPVPFRDDVFSLVDDRLALGDCSEGRFEVATSESRLTCLIHRSKPYLAGLQEGLVFSRVPLYDFVTRCRQLEGASCTLIRTDMPLVLMTAIHFHKRSMLKGSTSLVDPSHVLDVLARDREDAAIAFERSGKRTLLFLKGGHPARLYFGDPADDPGQGRLEERALAFAFDPAGVPCAVEVFTDLKMSADPDAGTPLVELAESTRPAPPVDICLYYPDGREVRRRPYAGPEMIVGRDPKVDLFIDNLAVSRRHARITWQRGSFVIEDLGSANGIYLDGERISEARIDSDSKVEIGKFELSIFEYRSEPKVLETMFIPVQATPVAGFLVGEGVSEKIEQGKDLLLGKGEGVDIRARGFSVKPVHARLTCGSGGVELSCFGTTKARVNGDKVRFAKLSFGDEIRIGRTLLQLTQRPA